MTEEIIDTEVIEPEDPNTDPIDPPEAQAPLCPTEMITKFLNYYKQIGDKKYEEDSFLMKNQAKIIKELNSYGLTNEEKAKALTDIYVKTVAEFDKNSSASVISLLKQEADTPLKCAQVTLVGRQHQGYDDSLLIKIMEQQGGLASFAVNSDSKYAQETIDSLKHKMEQIQSRSKPVDNEVPAPVPVPVPPTPLNLRVLDSTDTSVTMVWDAVGVANSYQVYMDGVEVFSGGELIVVVPSLLPLTKYAFNVRCTATSPSPISKTVIASTIATP